VPCKHRQRPQRSAQLDEFLTLFGAKDEIAPIDIWQASGRIDRASCNANSILTAPQAENVNPHQQGQASLEWNSTC
jgi:hypothetical protein